MADENVLDRLGTVKGPHEMEQLFIDHLKQHGYRLNLHVDEKVEIIHKARAEVLKRMRSFPKDKAARRVPHDLLDRLSKVERSLVNNNAKNALIRRLKLNVLERVKAEHKPRRTPKRKK